MLEHEEASEERACSGDRIHVWRFQARSAHRTHLCALVFRQDEQDVRLGNPCLGKGGAEDGWKQSQQTQIHTSRVSLLSCCVLAIH